MRFSRAFIPTLRDDPAEADTISHKLLLRGGFIRRVASGIYEWLPLGLRVLKKVEGIVREEMNAIAGQEVLLPVVQPKELWEQSGRWQKYGKELLRIKDRKDAEFCLSPTAEEVITTLVARNVRSWRSLPLMLYQIGTKFRDEIRPRFGLLRGREFIMKDAYSFHADEADAERYYDEIKGAYCKVFDRLGLKYRAVEAETGPIGGSFSHEFMVLAETGEDLIVYCTGCDYAANLERAECGENGVQSSTSDVPGPEDFATPGLYSVEDVAKFLKTEKNRFVKTLFYWADAKKPVVCLLRGDHELNEAKLRRALKAGDLKRMEEAEYEKLCGAPVGFAGPQGLSARAKKTNAEAVVIGDHAVKTVTDGVSGANKKDFHTQHLQYGRDFDADLFADLRLAMEGDACPRCGKGNLAFLRGIEVGHVFKLGTKYSVALEANYLDPQGKAKPMIMGCYGIGVSRIVATAVEQSSDKDGIIWPRTMAPYQIIVTAIDITKDERIRKEAESIYEGLKAAGLEVLLDDRDEQAGVKFKDADLLGIPLGVRVSSRTLKDNQAELKLRNGAPKRVPLAEAAAQAQSELANYRL
ncbi:MAG: proline--tRNA ligase [Elusimicrobia bacterium]|nr:proline--tRNA ligase [Elusimicrobiota bacterium]